MKTRVLRRKGSVTLVADRGVPGAGQEVLAALQQMADSENWFVIDIRLLQRPIAHEYSGSAAAEDFCAHIKPESKEEREFHLSKLRDFIEDPDGTLLWCTYRNMWRGEQGVGGYTPPSKVKPSVYMPFKTGLGIMKGIREYWAQYDGPISEAKIENPYLQPREGELMRDWWMVKNGYCQQGVEP